MAVKTRNSIDDGSKGNEENTSDSVVLADREAKGEGKESPNTDEGGCVDGGVGGPSQSEQEMLNEEENQWPKLTEDEMKELEAQRPQMLVQITKDWKLDTFIDIFPEQTWLKGSLEQMTDDKWHIRTIAAFLETSRMSRDRANNVRETLARLWKIRSHKTGLGIEKAAKEKKICDDLRRICEEGEMEKTTKGMKNKRSEHTNQGENRKSARQKKRTWKAIQASADDENIDDGDDEFSAIKRAKRPAPPHPQYTVIRTGTEMEEALKSIYRNWDIESVSQDLPAALLPEKAIDDSGIDWQILANLRDLSEVSKTGEDRRNVRDKLGTALKDRFGVETEKITADIAIIGESYHYTAQQEAMVDDDPIDGFSDAGSVHEEWEARDEMPVKETIPTSRDQPAVPDA
ncbi:mitochondrial rho GTPase 1 [Stemphylium lycopersici]|nr:mitochondrial rho GTPase 1 [Stemphylium lycopersici]